MFNFFSTVLLISWLATLSNQARSSSQILNLPENRTLILDSLSSDQQENLLKSLVMEKRGLGDSSQYYLSQIISEDSLEIPNHRNAPKVLNRLQLNKIPLSIYPNANGLYLQNPNGKLFSIEFEKEINLRNLYDIPQQKIIHISPPFIFSLSSPGELNIHSLENQMTQNNPLPSEFVRVFAFEKDLTLIFCKFHILAYKGKHMLWQKEIQSFSACQFQTDSKNLFLTNCSDGTIKKINPLSGEEQPLWQWNEKIQSLQQSGHFLFIQSQSKLYLVSLTDGNILWSIPNARSSTVHFWNGYLLLHNPYQIKVLLPRNGRLISSYSIQNDHLLILENQNLILFSKNGMLQQLDTNFNQIDYYHSGTQVEFTPFILDSTLIFIDTKGALTRYNLNNNPWGMSPRKFYKTQLQEQCLKNQTELCQKWADSLHFLEPGAPEWLYFKASQSPSNSPERLSYLGEALQKFRNYDKIPPAMIQSIRQELDLNWILPLPTGPSYSPIFHYNQMDKNVYFTGQDASGLYKIDAKKGSISTEISTDSTDIYLYSKAGKLFLTQKQLLFKPNQYPNPFASFPFQPAQILPSDSGWVFTGKGGEWESRNFLMQNPILWQNILPKNNLFQTLFKDQTISVTASGNLHRFQYTSHGISSEMEFLGASVLQANQMDSLMIFALTNGQILVKPTLGGTPLWSRNYPQQVFSFTPVNENQILIGNNLQQLELLDMHTGKTIWTFQGEGSLLIQPSIKDPWIYIDQGKDLIVIDLRTGREVYRKQFPFEIGRVQKIENQLLIPCAPGFILSLEVNSLRI